jgi:20S proteasome alpha/beta subunit
MVTPMSYVRLLAVVALLMGASALCAPPMIFGEGAVRVASPGGVQPPSTSVKQETYVRRGTLAVAIIESNHIVIAIDSRITTYRFGRGNLVQDNVEKVISLSPKIVFFFTGAGLFASPDSTNSLNEIAQTLASEWKRQKREIQLERFASEFKVRTATALSALSLTTLYSLHLHALKNNGSNVFQAVMGGKDADDSFKLFRVTGNAIAETNHGLVSVRLAYELMEEKRTGTQFVLYGVTRPLWQGANDPGSPLAPMFRQLKSSTRLLPEPVAARLVDAGIRELGDDPDSPVGYPIFVYVLDSDGCRMTRKVKKGDGVTFNPADQNK